VLGLEPTFDSASENVTMIAGQTALLPCFITYLGKYKVYQSIDDALLKRAQSNVTELMRFSF